MDRRWDGVGSRIGVAAAGAAPEAVAPGLVSGPGVAAPERRAPRSFEVHEATIAALQAALADGRVTSASLVDAYLERIGAYDGKLRAVLRINASSRTEAERLDRERAARGPRGPLHGVPILLKDNFDMHDLPTTGGSIALDGMVPPDDAFVVRRLRDAGAIVLAKTNLHELAAGITTISSLGGQTRNPYDTERCPGGSSGGTGAGVAASYAAIGYGTDTCGSIRIPAAFNALYGLRPTKGLVDMDGVIPLSHSQDVAGPLARTVADLAIGLDAIVGLYPADPATRTHETARAPRFEAALRADAPRGARIGVLDALFDGEGSDAEVLAIVRAAIERLCGQGAEIVAVEIDGLGAMLEDTSLIEHEFKFDLFDYLAATPGAPVHSLGEILEKQLYHPALEVKFRKRDEPVARDTPAYRAALGRRAALRAAVLEAMDRGRLDALAYPVMRTRPARIDEAQLGETCQLSASTGTPAIAIPAGFTADGLPIGLELLGRPLDDARLVGFAFAIEQASAPRRPPPLTPPLG